MIIDDAKLLIKDLMSQHGLSDWIFKLDHARQRCGSCNYTRSTISLSKYFIQLNDVDEVTNVALHEIAHALAGPGHAHDRHWRAIATAIGARAEACAPVTVGMPAPKWSIKCQGCETILATRHRRTMDLTTRACPQCRHRRHKLVWQQTG